MNPKVTGIINPKVLLMKSHRQLHVMCHLKVHYFKGEVFRKDTHPDRCFILDAGLDNI
jgi:hypothetical protein